MKKWHVFLVAVMMLTLCGVAANAECNHTFGELTAFDDVAHGYVCTLCGFEDITGMHSGVYNITEETCSIKCECGYEAKDQPHQGGMGVGDGFHGEACNLCGTWVWKEECFDSCAEPDGECEVCGSKAVTVKHEDELEYEVEDPEQHKVFCQACKDVPKLESHVWGELTAFDDVVHGYVCTLCGFEDITGMHSGVYDITEETCSIKCECGYEAKDQPHQGGMGVGDGFHGEACNLCDTWVWKEECFDSCAEPDGECEVCGSKAVTVKHVGELEYEVEDPEQHKVFCQACKDAPKLESHVWGELTAFDDVVHGYVCTLCGFEDITGMHTGVYDITEETCSIKCECGYEAKDQPHQDAMTGGDDFHGRACNICGAYTWKETCYETCKNPDGICDVCSNPAVILKHEYEPVYEKVDDENHLVYCQTCQLTPATEAHTFDEDGVCTGCGAVEVKPCTHETTACRYVGGMEHCVECADCGEMITMSTCTFECLDDEFHTSACEYCKDNPVKEAHYTFDMIVDLGDGTHGSKCFGCDWTQVMGEHVFDENGLCTVCGAQQVLECDHEYSFQIYPAPKCDKTGVLTEICTLCGAEGRVSTLKALGHDMATEETETQIREYCTRCGLETITEKVTEPAILPEDVEKIEVADCTVTGETVEENVVLLVEEVISETAVEIPLAVEAEVVKVFQMTLLKDGEEVEAAGTLKVAIPVTEELLAELEGKTLVLVNEDGTVVEIEYEVIDGQIVFETEALGVFAFVVKAE